MPSQQHSINIYATPTIDCPYLPEQSACNGIADCGPHDPYQTYSWLIRKGFRRSSDFIYRPFCSTCQACISSRVLVDEFQPSRSQKRIIKRNKALKVTINGTGFHDKYQDLYTRYLLSRHDETQSGHVKEFFEADWCETLYVEFSIDNTLLGVAVVDVVEDGLSAVYTFFEPCLADKYSIGSYAILWQIEFARQHKLPYVYLGYWIAECKKMHYKSRYQPLEGYIEDQWQSIPAYSSD